MQSTQLHPSLLDHSDFGLSIKDAATFASVSQATIRNWIKSGNIYQEPNGLVNKSSIENFKLGSIGKRKLIARANKSSKNNHDHAALTTRVLEITETADFDSNTISENYESSLSESFRNKEGIYYTPPSIIEDLVQVKTDSITNATFCDPCCGSGNFLIHALQLGFNPRNIYGFDTDENAVAIANRRIFELTGLKSNNIKQADFLREASTNESLKFDFVFTNPPWEKKYKRKKRRTTGHCLAQVSL
jgi:site-specific DNA-methyltransferase (adenine-specific)